METPGVYRPDDRTFYLRNTPNGPVSVSVTTGNWGDLPIVGDWNGDGSDDIGLYRPSTREFFLYYEFDDPPTISVTIGDSGDIPVAGDWDGDGVCGVGVYRPSTRTFWLYNNPQGQPDQQITFGNPGDIPICGRWGGSSGDGIGVYRSLVQIPDIESHIFFLDFDRDGSSDLIRDFSDPRFEKYRLDERIIGWQFADEPLGAALADTNHPPPPIQPILDDLRAAYEMYSQGSQQQFMAPEVPLTQGDSVWWFQFINALSLGCHDNYPKRLDSPFTSLNDVAYTMSEQTTTLSGEKPSWFVVQAFYANPSSGNFRWAMPTPREARAMVFTAIVHGATGIVYFTWDSWVSRSGDVIGIAPNPQQEYPEGGIIAPPGLLDESQELWNGIAEINLQLDTLTSMILSKTDTAQYSVFVDDTSHEAVPVRTLLKGSEESRCLLAVNISSCPLNARFQFSDSIPALVMVMFENGRSLASSQNAFTDHFDGFGVHVYSMSQSSMAINHNRTIPYTFVLSQNYPNPFNSQTVIAYSLPKISDVTIDIFDIQGRAIQTPFKGMMAAGEHAVMWNAEHVPSGVYFCRMEAGKFSQTRKMVLLK